MPAPVNHVFVLVLENRSFDHMFGFSGLTGVDAETGAPTSIDGLTGAERNVLAGTPVTVSRGADFQMPRDPGHEFLDVLEQLCGAGVPFAAPYPAIDNSGFVSSYARAGAGSAGAGDAGEIMKCFDTARELPVLHALATEFALCDRWFSSLPGPTWPNRMFVHAASSGGLDHSPSTPEILVSETVDGFGFAGGTIFDALRTARIPYGLFSGDDFPMVASLKGVALTDVGRIDGLLSKLNDDPFPYSYVFIEPSYDILDEFRGGNSQHPLGDVRAGEALVKQVYEALRKSSAWSSSVLVVVWDEHGGFYDHVAPPPATPPGDAGPGSRNNEYGFTFARYGVRVPAIVVSPYVERGTIDHRVYDHSSVPATLEAQFRLPPLSARDRAANTLLPLLSRTTPRTDAPTLLPAPPAAPARAAAVAPRAIAAAQASGSDPMDRGVLPGVVHVAMRHELAAARSPGERQAIVARVAALATRDDAKAYLRRVQSTLAR